MASELERASLEIASNVGGIFTPYTDIYIHDPRMSILRDSLLRERNMHSRFWLDSSGQDRLHDIYPDLHLDALDTRLPLINTQVVAVGDKKDDYFSRKYTNLVYGQTGTSEYFATLGNMGIVIQGSDQGFQVRVRQVDLPDQEVIINEKGEFKNASRRDNRQAQLVLANNASVLLRILRAKLAQPIVLDEDEDRYLSKKEAQNLHIIGTSEFPARAKFSEENEIALVTMQIMFPNVEIFVSKPEEQARRKAEDARISQVYRRFSDLYHKEQKRKR